MLNQQKILVIDDDSTTREIFLFYLSDYEHVVLVDSGEKAILECKSNHFNLVLTDIKSTLGINGIATLNQIRTIEGYAGVPIIAITGYAMEGVKGYLIGEGFDGYLAKPFLKQTFIEFISNFLI